MVSLPPSVRGPAAARAAASRARTLVGSLHRAAAEWHEQEGYIVEAIRHAQAARDWTLASRLLADHHIDLTFDGRSGSISQLLSVFPDDVVAADAELALVFATARLLHGALEKSAGLSWISPGDRPTRFPRSVDRALTCCWPS